MKNFIFIFFTSFQLLACGQNEITTDQLDLLFNKNFEHSLISKGNNFPDFNPEKDQRLGYFLVALHENISPEKFRKKAGFSQIEMDSLTYFLKSKTWLHEVDGKLKPTVFIATQEDGEQLYASVKGVSTEIADSISTILPEIKQQFALTSISKSSEFDDWSFLILSDVLLDSWQIDHVESDFLNKDDRSERNGNHYYYSIMENQQMNQETFGIYGNQYEEIDGKAISIYGNNRNEITTIDTTNYISASDNIIFTQMAETFRPKLIQILNNNRSYILKVFQETGYQKEIAFEEFFIWWYHFLYTDITNQMASKGMLNIPQNGNFEYLLEE